jgi:hypothetical protein
MATQLEFDPPQGLLDINRFPSQPATEQAARDQFMQIFRQIRDFINVYTMMKDSISGSMDSGYIKIPLGNRTFMIQWGKNDGFSVPDNANGWAEFTFKQPFLDRNYVIIPSVYSTTSNKTSSGIDRYNVSSYNSTNAKYEIDVRNVYPNGATTLVNVNWVAFGEV